MARKRTLGYVQLEWTCPNCNSRNPGGIKTCQNCGAPQPENVQFEQPAGSKFVSDEKSLGAARSGPDIHCGFCGTRNPATAAVCSQCGGDLKEGIRRQAGRLMASPRPGPGSITCKNCGTKNPGLNKACSNCGAPLPGVSTTPPPAAPPSGSASSTIRKNPNWLMIGGIAVALFACCLAVFFVFVLPTSSVQATVTDIYWQTSVPVEEVQAVDYNNERGSPPSGAYNVSCDTQSEEVCEQKTIDKGNGFAEVVEDCHTETEQYCDYTRDEWTTIQTYTLDGHDWSPLYEQPDLASGQRLGGESVTYTVTFETEKGEKQYHPDDLGEYQQYDIGQVWTLKLNALGSIISVE